MWYLCHFTCAIRRTFYRRQMLFPQSPRPNTVLVVLVLSTRKTAGRILKRAKNSTREGLFRKKVFGLKQYLNGGGDEKRERERDGKRLSHLPGTGKVNILQHF